MSGGPGRAWAKSYPCRRDQLRVAAWHDAERVAIERLRQRAPRGGRQDRFSLFDFRLHGRRRWRRENRDVRDPVAAQPRVERVGIAGVEIRRYSRAVEVSASAYAMLKPERLV